MNFRMALLILLVGVVGCGGPGPVLGEGRELGDAGAAGDACAYDLDAEVECHLATAADGVLPSCELELVVCHGDPIPVIELAQSLAPEAGIFNCHRLSLCESVWCCGP